MAAPTPPPLSHPFFISHHHHRRFVFLFYPPPLPLDGRRDVPVPARVDVVGDVDAGLLEQVVHTPPVHESALHAEVVEQIRPAQRGVGLGLVEGICAAAGRKNGVGGGGGRAWEISLNENKITLKSMRTRIGNSHPSE